MTASLWRAALMGLAAIAFAFAAEAQPEGCSAELSNATYAGDQSRDAARMRCDLDRAARIRERANALYGGAAASLIQIVDTASPSGAAYVYDVMTDDKRLRLDARSVPDGRGPRCRLSVNIPDDTANAMSILLTQAADPSVPDYGPREEVTDNPDGSRTVRLVINSHDIITRAETENGSRNFSRHARSDDPVSRLNNLVIGVANVSSGWVCSAAS